MGPPVGGVVPLVGVDHAFGLFGGQFLGQAGGLVDVVVGVAVGHGRNLDQLGAAEPQHVLLFLGLGLGNDDDRTVAARPGDQGQADPGVAGGCFDDGQHRTIAHENDSERTRSLNRHFRQLAEHLQHDGRHLVDILDDE